MSSDSEKCQFLDSTGNVRALATRVNKLYKMHFTLLNKNYDPSTCFVYEDKNEENDCFDCFDDPLLCMKVSTIKSIVEWHEQLAHQNMKHIKTFLRRNNIEFSDCDKDYICQPCLAGKQHRLSFENSSSRASAPLKLVHTDLCGPMETASLGNSRYFLLFKDDYSAYRYVYFLQHKSEVKTCLEKFINLAERETECKMKILRSDNGLEFINKEVTEILEGKGIRHQRTIVYTPQQNGRAERENRTLVEAARTLLSTTEKLDKTFWAEAINTVTYILNRTGPSPKCLESPYKLWHKKDIELHNFKIFGSTVSVHVPKETRLKLDVKKYTGYFSWIWGRY